EDVLHQVGRVAVLQADLAGPVIEKRGVQMNETGPGFLFLRLAEALEQANGRRVHGIAPRLGLASLYSHSIVAGGLRLISFTTRLTPATWLMIRVETWASRS